MDPECEQNFLQAAGVVQPNYFFYLITERLHNTRLEGGTKPGGVGGGASI